MSLLFRFKVFAKNNRVTARAYERLKTGWVEYKRNRRLRGEYTFENRSQSREKLCIVLAGYKQFLYPNVLGRIKRFAPEDMDICLLTSGLYSQEISKICAENHWSYISTKKNNVCLIQNIAIHAHPGAKYVFKLDEDIFITEGFFDKMMAAYRHAGGGQISARRDRTADSAQWIRLCAHLGKASIDRCVRAPV